MLVHVQITCRIGVLVPNICDIGSMSQSEIGEMKITKFTRQCLFFVSVCAIYIFLKATYRHFHAEKPIHRYPCTHDHLGHSEYAKELCLNQTTNVSELLTCRNILNGNFLNNSYNSIRSAMKSRPRQMTSDSYYITATSDCKKFKNDRGFHSHPLSREEEYFPIAFTILAHTNADQIERLLRALYRPQNIYCIHVDAKSNAEFFQAILSIARCFGNVFVASRLEAVIYWGYSRLQADINCMNDLLNSSTQWRYLINTAAQAFPIRSIGEMVKILKIYNGANDIEGIYGARVLRSRFQLEWKENPEWNSIEMTGRNNPRPPDNLDIVKGSAYGIFSREFVKFVIHDQRAINLLNWSRTTLTPDEHYWATLHHTYTNPHLHTPGAFSGYPDDKPWLAVYADWEESTCKGQVVRNVCVFGIEDLPRLINRKEFFVNKFYPDFEPLALDCLEAWIQQKTVCPEPFDDHYYRELPFIKK